MWRVDTLTYKRNSLQCSPLEGAILSITAVVPNPRAADCYQSVDQLVWAAQETIISVVFITWVQSFIFEKSFILKITGFSQSLERQRNNPQAIKMSEKQTSLKSFFSKGKRPSEETEAELTTSKKKKKLLMDNTSSTWNVDLSRQVIPTDQVRPE